MSKYVLDTGIVLGILRGASYASYVESRFAVSSPPNISLISVVTLGELYSLAFQLGWGQSKMQQLKEILKEIPLVDISNNQIIDRYAEIDSYSQGKNLMKTLPKGVSSRNMGKNDVWIAATASVTNAVLLTTDKDFTHLNGEFLSVEYIDQNINQRT